MIYLTMKKDDLTIENEDLAVQNAWAANAQWAWPRNYAMVRVDSVPSMVWLKWTTNANHGDESQLSGFVAKLVVVFIQYMSFVFCDWDKHPQLAASWLHLHTYTSLFDAYHHHM